MEHKGLFPKQASLFRVGEHILLKNTPCVIVEMATSKMGKHGGCKIKFTTKQLFGGKTVEEIAGSTSMMQAVQVTKKDYYLMHVQDDVLELIDEEGQPGPLVTLGSSKVDRQVAELHPDRGEKDIVVTIIEAMGMMRVFACKS